VYAAYWNYQSDFTRLAQPIATITAQTVSRKLGGCCLRSKASPAAATKKRLNNSYTFFCTGAAQKKATPTVILVFDQLFIHPEFTAVTCCA
jgi:hypothetical protein